MKTALGLNKLNKVVYRKEENIVYVCFVLDSMVNSVKDWYDKNFKYDALGLTKNAHVFHLIRFYDDSRFRDHETIGEERDKYLSEVDMYVQMRRDD